MINLQIEKQIQEKAPLYQRYETQTLPQQAFIYLFDNGNVYIDCNHEPSNNISFDEFYGRTITFPVSEYLSGNQIKELFEDEVILNLLNKVHEGHTLEYRSQDPPIGKLTDEAIKAKDQLQDILDDIEGEIQVWNVNDWLFDNQNLFDHWNQHTSLQDAIKYTEGLVEYNQIIYGDMEEALLNEAHHRFTTNKPIYKTHIKELLKRNLITKDDLDD